MTHVRSKINIRSSDSKSLRDSEPDQFRGVGVHEPFIPLNLPKSGKNKIRYEVGGFRNIIL